jgi:antitoxin (DNA-binding transcriptional repressor) of toxin-antitoxin stability system
MDDPCYDSTVKSDVVRVSASDAARDFAALLDRVEAGAEAIIERDKHPVAILAPAAGAPRAISECLAIALARPATSPDEDFASDLEQVIQANPVSEPPPWG